MASNSTSRNAGDGQSLLNKFFMDELQDVYGAEKELMNALPKLEKAATSPDLAMAFADHRKTTQQQIGRLDQIFQMLGTQWQGKKCEGMAGLLKEGETVISETEGQTSTRDVGLIISAQKAEHYEIAAYGSLRQLAKTINKPQISQLLEETLEEEKATDMLLSNLAETMINENAKQEAMSK